MTFTSVSVRATGRYGSGPDGAKPTSHVWALFYRPATPRRLAGIGARPRIWPCASVGRPRHRMTDYKGLPESRLGPGALARRLPDNIPS